MLAAALGLACLSAAALAAEGQIATPPRSTLDPITFGASRASRWVQGGYDVWLLEGNCYLQQGATYAQGREAVLWIHRPDATTDDKYLVLAYFEGEVTVDDQRKEGYSRLADKSWFGEFRTVAAIEPRTPPPGPEPGEKPAVYRNGMARREPVRPRPIQRTDFFPQRQESLPPPGPVDPLLPRPEVEEPPESILPGLTPTPGGARRLRAFPRSAVPVQAQWFPSPDGREWIAVITSGVNLVIDGLVAEGPIDIAADRIVIWTQGTGEPDLSGRAVQRSDTPLELYLEGNVVFRQGERVMYAERMFYNVNTRSGTILDAELLTPVPTYQGLARLRAAVIEQVGSDRYLARGAYLTTSRMGRPRYRLQSEEIVFDAVEQPALDALTGQPLVDPQTGEPLVASSRRATSNNNFVFLGEVPVFYWPTIATDLEEPTFYLQRVRVRNDQIFGTQVLTDWNAYELLGIENEPPGTDWTVSADYFSERGFAAGTDFTYLGENLFGTPGPYYGFADFWGMPHDSGLDILGSDRMNLFPEERLRYRLLARHRQNLPDGYQFSAQLGKISDRNFLEQWFEKEWDTQSDQLTDLEFKRITDNKEWALYGQVRLNEFFTQTEWLPRFDHFVLGEPLLGDRLTWYEHSQVGYGRQRIFSTPENPSDAAKQQPMPWELTVQGERAVTRQELDLPLEMGPLKIVPYVLGEAAHWGEDLSGDDLQRLYGQAGVRASLPFWAVFPNVESDLFNVHGLANKVTFDADLSYADANRDIAQFPLYDSLDDDSIEHFRRRLTFNTFNGVLPPQADVRNYALRSGLQNWVTSPSVEIADDLLVARLGWRNRWQTKRGPPGRRRIIDWIVFDNEIAFFPDADRDNFGEYLGLYETDFRWHVGDRLTLLSSSGMDFFDEGQRTLSVGAVLTRPPRGNIYVGFRSLEGPFTSNVLISYFSYQLSPKWFTSSGLSYDFSNSGTIGNTFNVSRVGESFVVSFQFSYDAYKDNVAASFMIEPRFLPLLSRGAFGSAIVPPLGAYGLE